MYVGPPIDDPDILELLPDGLRDFLVRCNGYVAFRGGLHVRGACRSPTWHSLRYWWFGSSALHTLFPSVDPGDIPFGQDAFGDQFLLRDGLVHRLAAETGAVECLEVDLADFDAAARADPLGFLRLHPLEQFRAEGGELEPGQLLSVYPPFVFKESAAGVSLKAIGTEDRIRFLADLARQIAAVPDGKTVEIRWPR